MAARLIPRISAASEMLCRWISQRRNTSRQLRCNCSACISTACNTPEGIVVCPVVDRCLRMPFTRTRLVIVEIGIRAARLCPSLSTNMLPPHFAPVSRMTPKPSPNGSGEAENDASPRRQSPPSGGWVPGEAVCPAGGPTTRNLGCRPSCGDPVSRTIEMVQRTRISFHCLTDCPTNLVLTRLARWEALFREGRGVE